MATIKNDRDIVLQTAAYRVADTSVTISSTGTAFNTAKNGGLTTPSSITLSSTTNNVFTASAVTTWHYSLNSNPGSWVSLGTGTSKIITSASILAIIGTATEITYRCTVTEPLLNTAYDFLTVPFITAVSDPLLIDISRTNATIASSSNGTPLGYTNTNVTIKVTRGTALSYSAVPSPNSFSVAAPTLSTGVTIGTPTTTSDSYNIPNITGVTQDYSTITFNITIYNAQGVAEPLTYTRQVVYTKVTNGVVGTDSTIYYLDLTSPVISKSTSAAGISGTHTNITATGKRVIGSGAATNFGYLTITANGDTEATIATANTLTTSINNTAGKTSYTVKLYNQATVSGATLLDSEIVPVVFTGSSAVTVALTNDSVTVPTDSAGNNGIYTSSGTNIYVYEGTTPLTYDNIGTALGTWKVVLDFATNITVGSISGSGSSAIVGVASGLTANTGSLRYLITGTTLGGAVFSQTKTQTFSKSVAGMQGLSTFVGTVYLKAASTPAAPTTGTGSYNFNTNALTAPAGWSNTQPATESALGTYASTFTFVGAPTDTVPAGTWSTVRLEAQNGSAGNNGEYRDMVQLFGTSTVVPTTAYYNFTNNTISSSNVSVVAVPNWSLSMPTVTTTPVYMTTSLASTTTPATNVTLSAWTSAVVVAQKGSTGDPGPSGTKAITISAFKWSNSGIGTFTQGFTYTWSNGSGIVYPSGWTASAPAATGSGYTLYQINLTIVALATDTTTVTNWSSAVSNTVGYRQDGDIGPQGNSHRTAYIVTQSSTAPIGIVAGTGDVPPSSPGIWSFTATSVLNEGDYLYQVDGILVVGGNITWNSAYLSNLKVGSLSAITANLGTVGISTTGSLASTGKTYGSATAGIFLGYNSTAYKFDVGNSTNYLRWNGTGIEVQGTITGGLATSYTTGTGLWAGLDGATYKFRVGSNTSAMTWDGTALRIGGITAEVLSRPIYFIGDFATAPATAGQLKNYVYKNTADGNSYIMSADSGTWNIYISKGSDGADGGDGLNGDPGLRGSLTGYGNTYSLYYLTSWADSSNSTSTYRANRVIQNMLLGEVLTTDLTTTAHLRIGDTVTLANAASATAVITKYWSGSAWVSPGVIIDGNLLVTGSVAAAKINTNGLEIKDGSGNVIFSSGVPIDYTRVGGTKPPSNADKTSLNTAAGISGQGALATLSEINGTYISSLSADKISSGTFSGASIAIASSAGGWVFNAGLNGTQVSYRTLNGYNIYANNLASPTVAALRGVTVASSNAAGVAGEGNGGGHGLSGFYSGGAEGHVGSGFGGGAGKAFYGIGNSYFQGNVHITGNLTIGGTYPSGGGSSGVSSFNTRTGAVTLSASDVTNALGATYVQNASYASSAGSAGSATTASAGSNGGSFSITAGSYITTFQATDGNTVTRLGGTVIWSAQTGWTSDRRLKTDIVPTIKSGLDTIKLLEVIDFKWKESSIMGDGGILHTGFIAQQVHDIIPEAASEVAGTFMVNKGDIVPYLVKAVQELTVEIATLRSQVNNL